MKEVKAKLKKKSLGYPFIGREKRRLIAECIFKKV
jgi:hypothetical protein